MDRWAGSTHLRPDNNAVALLQPKGTRIVISSMALKTINIRWIIAGSQWYWKIMYSIKLQIIFIIQWINDINIFSVRLRFKPITFLTMRGYATCWATVIGVLNTNNGWITTETITSIFLSIQHSSSRNCFNIFSFDVVSSWDSNLSPHPEP